MADVPASDGFGGDEVEDLLASDSEDEPETEAPVAKVPRSNGEHPTAKLFPTVAEMEALHRRLMFGARIMRMHVMNAPFLPDGDERIKKDEAAVAAVMEACNKIEAAVAVIETLSDVQQVRRTDPSQTS